jgi:hypothetical protein
MESVAKSSVEGYKTIINQCYYGWQQRMYGCQYWMYMAEGGTDIWNYQKNGNSLGQYFKYDLGLATKDNSFKDQWLAFYDGIGSCNTAISLANLAPFKTDSAKNTLVAEAYFLRAVYYFQLVEQYGGITVILEPPKDVDLQPERNIPLDVYKQTILPDLEFAAKWLPVNNELSRPSKKSALGFLALAYLQTVEYDDTKAYAPKALETAKILTDDCDAGGSLYGAYLYPAFSAIFDTLNVDNDINNYKNKEALWAHRFIRGGANPRGPQELNENDQLFYCNITSFAAVTRNYFKWGGSTGGKFMPTHYLLNTFIQDDGSLDPRYHQSFQTYWPSNKAYTWTTGYITSFDRSDSVTTTSKLAIGDSAVLLIHPNDTDYNQWIAKKRDTKYLVVDLADVYANDTVRMLYTRVKDGATTGNPFLSFYPSLIKHNSRNIFEVQAGKKYGNLNATIMMRMSEVYLIAAEADLYSNGGANALTYLNKVRNRAGARPLTEAVTIQTILDERARELCGEYNRWNDLKRTRNLTKEYLMSKNPDVGKYFNNDKNKVKQIPLIFLQTLENGGAYYQNPNY